MPPWLFPMVVVFVVVVVVVVVVVDVNVLSGRNLLIENHRERKYDPPWNFAILIHIVHTIH